MTTPTNLYADQVGLRVTEHTLTLTFMVDNGNNTSQLVGAVNLPPVVGKHIAMMLRRNLKLYEEKYGVMHVPMEVLEKMKCSPEDW